MDGGYCNLLLLVNNNLSYDVNKLLFFFKFFLKVDISIPGVGNLSKELGTPAGATYLCLQINN